MVLIVGTSFLTDDGATLAVSREFLVQDGEEHGVAEDQRDLEGVAFTSSQRQGEADHVSQDDQNGGKHQCDEGVEMFYSQQHLSKRKRFRFFFI